MASHDDINVHTITLVMLNDYKYLHQTPEYNHSSCTILWVALEIHSHMLLCADHHQTARFLFIFFSLHHQISHPLCGRLDTCDGSQVFTCHNSIETLPKNKYLQASGAGDGIWITDLDINTYIGAGERGWGGPWSQCLVLYEEPPPGLTTSGKKGKSTGPCLFDLHAQMWIEH